MKSYAFAAAAALLAVVTLFNVVGIVVGLVVRDYATADQCATSVALVAVGVWLHYVDRRVRLLENADNRAARTGGER